MSDNLMYKLTHDRDSFSKGQKRIADFIIEHYDKAAFMTANKLGQTVDVSESTVVRFATELGYSGYPHMQKVLREMVSTRLTSLQKIALTSERLRGRNVAKSIMENDIDKIRGTLETMDGDTFNQAVDMIINARHIYILGMRSASFLAGFLGFYFRLIFDNVTVVGDSSNESDIFENLFRVNEKDVVIGITFPRYSKRTLRGMRFARARNAGLVAITDAPSSPITEIGNCTLFAPCEIASFVDSLVAPLSLINALIVAIGMRKEKEVTENFKVLESIWEEHDTYEKYDNP